MIPAHVRNRNAVILKVLEATLGEQSESHRDRRRLFSESQATMAGLCC